jgi:chemotaxis family two-component system sensor kinase Cph1
VPEAQVPVPSGNKSWQLARASVSEIECSLQASLDLTSCGREMIHIPGSIQPHGVLLVCDVGSLIVRSIGGDISRLLGGSDYLGSHVSGLIGDVAADVVSDVASSSKRAFVGSIQAMDGKPVDVTAHLVGENIIFELEPRDQPVWSSSMLLGRMETASGSFDEANTLLELCEAAARQFRILTGYDRVMVYRFGDDGAGVVLAEDRRAGLHSFLNHHFPAGDIPKQARALYVRNLLRVIPRVDYVPAAIEPPREDAPLDLSDSILRSVSPVHLEYLKNMGVAASASVSIVKDGALWGLIACHHETLRGIFYDVRAACRTLASGLARQIKSREETEIYRDRLRLRGSADALVAALETGPELDEEILHHLPEFMRLMGADGFAVVGGSGISSTGLCPSESQIKSLVGWIAEKTADSTYATRQLSDMFGPAKEFEAVGAGVLALRMSSPDRLLLLWFRAEEMQIVEWAGNPHRDSGLAAGEKLTPRASFEAWQETVHGRARAWSTAEMETTARLRSDLAEMRSTQRLRDLNRRLMETVAEKDALLDQKKFLIGEVNHRVQNSLQLVSSFLSFQAKESGDPKFKSAVIEATRRIGAVSLLHRSLYRSDEIGVTNCGRYLEDLVEHLIGSIGEEWRPLIHLDLGPVMLPLNSVIPVGLIVTELVININKYAYGGLPGPIEVTLSEGRSSFTVMVVDRGKGRTSERVGFGTRMMKGLVAQLAGELSFEDNAPGVRAVLSGSRE